MKKTSLFDPEMTMTAPLASRMRPTDLDHFVGQKHLVGDGKFLREMIEKDQVTSMIFWGLQVSEKRPLLKLLLRKPSLNLSLLVLL